MKLSRRIRESRKALEKRKKPRLAVPCLRALELPEDVAAGEARIVLCGRSCALVENIEGISELNGDRIRLRLKSGEVSVAGAGLDIQELRADAVKISGRIRAVSLEGGAV